MIMEIHGYIFLLLVPSAIFVTAEAWSTRVEKKSQDEAVESRQVTLECHVTGRTLNSGEEIRWIQESREIPTNMPKKYLIQGNLLIIRNLNRTDSGNWRCGIYDQMEKKLLESQQITFHLEVLYPPANPSISCNSSQIVAGSKISCICHVTDPGVPPGDILWRQNGYLMSHSGPELITIPTKVGSNNYQCEISNKISSVKRSGIHEVHVEVPPTIEECHSSMKDKLIEVTCITSGKHVYNRQLHFGNMFEQHGKPSEVPEEGNFSFGQNQAMKSVVLLKFNTDKLTCDNTKELAVNFTADGTILHEERTAFKTINISIHYPPMIDGSKTEIVAREDDKDISIQCPICGHPTPAITKWKYNYGPLPEEVVQETDASLVIHQVAIEHKGVYTCTGINSINGIEKSATANIELKVKECQDQSNSCCERSSVKNAVIGVLCLIVALLVFAMGFIKRKFIRTKMQLLQNHWSGGTKFEDHPVKEKVTIESEQNDDNVQLQNKELLPGGTTPDYKDVEEEEEKEMMGQGKSDEADVPQASGVHLNLL